MLQLIPDSSWTNIWFSSNLTNQAFLFSPCLSPPLLLHIKQGHLLTLWAYRKIFTGPLLAKTRCMFPSVRLCRDILVKLQFLIVSCKSYQGKKTVLLCVYACRGSAVANSLSQMIICLLLFGYIWWKKLHQQTWGGEINIFI